MTNLKFSGILTDEIDEGVKTLVVEFRELEGILLTAEALDALDEISRDYLSEAMNLEGDQFEIEFIRADALRTAQ